MTEYERYIKMYRKMHRTTDRFPGRSIKKHADEIGELIRKFDAKTILDYGCGGGDQYVTHRVQDRWPDVEIFMYDPAVPRFENKPDGVFDGVVVCDVMEHVPEEAVDRVLKDIFASAEKFAFFSIRNNPARVKLPDGTNAHCTLKGHQWWLKKIRAHSGAVTARVKTRGEVARTSWQMDDV